MVAEQQKRSAIPPSSALGTPRQTRAKCKPHSLFKPQLSSGLTGGLSSVVQWTAIAMAASWSTSWVSTDYPLPRYGWFFFLLGMIQLAARMLPLDHTTLCSYNGRVQGSRLNVYGTEQLWCSSWIWGSLLKAIAQGCAWKSRNCHSVVPSPTKSIFSNFGTSQKCKVLFFQDVPLINKPVTLHFCKISFVWNR